MLRMKKPAKYIPHTSANPLVDRLKSADRWWLLVIIVVALIVILIVFKPDPYLRILLFARDGVWVTFYTTIISFSMVLVIGLIGGLGRISHNRLINGIASIYVPSLIQDLGDTWNIPALSTYKANPLLMAILGLTFCYSAYMSEVYRAGIESIPKGQMEAARSLGMNYVQAMRYIILPQAVRMILPPVGNEFITLLKDSSLVSVVAVADLTRRGREFMAANFIPVQTWFMVALLYLILTLVAARVVSWLEKHSRYER